MSGHADTIRRFIGRPLTAKDEYTLHGFVGPHEATAALDALLAENQRLERTERKRTADLLAAAKVIKRYEKALEWYADTPSCGRARDALAGDTE